MLAHRRLQGVQSTVNYSAQDIGRKRESRRLFTVGDDMCKLSQIARVLESRVNAKQVENGLR